MGAILPPSGRSHLGVRLLFLVYTRDRYSREARAASTKTPHCALHSLIDSLISHLAHMAAPIPIHTGLWIDRSFESVIWGATLTLFIRQANHLITFLALLAAVCAGFFWIIVAYILHQLLARGRSVDVLDLQRQVFFATLAALQPPSGNVSYYFSLGETEDRLLHRHVHACVG